MTQIRWGGKWVHLAYIWIVCHLSAKNYQNRWKFDAVLTKTNLLSFFWDTVYIYGRAQAEISISGLSCFRCQSTSSWKSSTSDLETSNSSPSLMTSRSVKVSRKTCSRGDDVTGSRDSLSSASSPSLPFAVNISIHFSENRFTVQPQYTKYQINEAFWKTEKPVAFTTFYTRRWLIGCLHNRANIELA